MVTTITPELRKDSHELVTAVESDMNIFVHAAAWDHEPETGRWRLVLLSKATARLGPTALFTSIGRILSEHEFGMSLEDITVAIPGVNEGVTQMASFVGVSRSPVLEPPPEFVNTSFNGSIVSHAWLLWSVPPIPFPGKRRPI